MERSRIDAYIAGGPRLVDAFSGLTSEDFTAIPIPGTWSLQQIAVHLFDSDLIGADRIKRVACMDRPLLIGYDQTAFSQLPGVNLIDAVQACRIVAQTRELTGIILRNLPDAAFELWGIHNEVGKVTLAELVEKYIHHLEGHLAHVKKKREILGKPLSPSF
ncbi:MAG: DinB family protein [Pirellulales bacterium]